MIPSSRLSSLARAALCSLAVLVPLAGCVVIADIDDGKIPREQGSGGASSSTSSSSSASTGGGGGGGAGGGIAPCTSDADCPGQKGDCGEPRCFDDGICGFDNHPIGAPCDEGGAACDGKGHCIECTADVHCTSQKCGPDRKCLPPTCSDAIENGDETDVDCGGSCAVHCGPEAGCVADEDCVGGACVAGVCAPTCDDGQTNAEETGTDCGGPACPVCPLGAACMTNGDCSSAYCNLGLCTPVPTCSDGAKNGEESDVDCGGPACLKCAEGGVCGAGGDCESGSCVSSACAAPSCDDGVKNGDEADVDCGVPCPVKCAAGTPCSSGADCASKICVGPAGSATCAAPSCFDGMYNGDETSWDCGGSCAQKCPPLYGCLVDGDCLGGLCDPVKLTCAPTCTDGYQNGGESDPDCGGPCPARCPMGGHCFTDDDCVPSTYCTQGHCLP